MSGESGVVAFEIGDDFVWVEFADKKYHYTYASAGADNVEHMKQLARDGRGLATFISREVKGRYAAKTAI